MSSDNKTRKRKGVDVSTDRVSDTESSGLEAEWERGRWYDSDWPVRQQSGSSCLKHAMFNYFGPGNINVQWGTIRDVGRLLPKLTAVASTQGKVLQKCQQHCDDLHQCVEWLREKNHTRALLHVKLPTTNTRSGKVEGNHFCVLKLSEADQAFVLDSWNKEEAGSLNVESVPEDKYDLEYGFQCTTLQLCAKHGEPDVFELSD